MKCYKCHCTMDKDYEYRTATCPMCGRTVTYRSNADKKRGYRYYPDNDDYEPVSALAWFLGGVIFWGIIVLFIAIVFGILYIAGVFKDGFWNGLGDIGMFFVNIIWAVIKFIAITIWNIITGIFHLIFG